MLTYSLAYESNSFSNGELGKLLINRFSRSLKLWWDHALTPEQKEAIRNHRTKFKRTIKIEVGSPVTQEVEEDREDAVETLLYTINMHFAVGN